MNTMICRSLALLLVLAMPRLAAAHGEKIPLRLNLRPGQLYTLRVASSAKSAMIHSKSKTNFALTTEMLLDYEVMKVDTNGQATVNVTFHPRAISVELGKKKSQYRLGDKAVAADNVIPQAMHALEGTLLTITYSPQGRILEIGGMEAMWRRSQERTPAATERDRGNIQMFERSLMQLVIGNLLNYSPEPVAVGDTWDNVFDDGAMQGHIRATCELRRRDNGKALIGFTARMSPLAPGSAELSSPAPEVMSLTMQGEYEVDETTGWPTTFICNFRGASQDKQFDPKNNVFPQPPRAYYKGGIRHVAVNPAPAAAKVP